MALGAPEAGASMRKEKAFGKLKRVELVELIYQLRKDNLALEAECQRLSERLEAAARLEMRDEAMHRLEQMVAALYEACFPINADIEAHAEAEESPCESTGDEEVSRQ